MPIMTIQAPDGTSFKIEAPEGATDEQVLRFAKSQGLFDKKEVEDVNNDSASNIPVSNTTERGLVEKARDSIVGGVEGALAVGSGLIAEPVAGLSGLVAAANPFGDEGDGVRELEFVRNLLTFEPKTPEGKAAISGLSELLQPVSEGLESVRENVAEDTFKTTGSPLAASLASALPDATIELLGLGTARRVAKDKAISPQVEQAEQAAIAPVDRLEETGIRQLTSDVFQPETRFQKFIQQQGELVAGGQRTAQQAERIKAVERLVDEFDITEGANYERGIFESLNNSIKADRAEIGKLFEESTSKLDTLGSVPLNKSKKFAQDVIERESLKGGSADNLLIDDLQNILDTPDDLSFELVKEIRSSVGRNLQAAKQGAPTGSSDTARLSQVYKNLTEDLQSFANNADKDLANKWKNADKVFSEFATGTNKTAVKSAIRNGEATPEVVNQLLFSNKNSDLEFLSNNLTPSGLNSAKKSIIQRMSDKTFNPDGTINPNGFQKQLRQNRNRVGKFFNPQERKAITALNDALASTRRAQDASVTTATGQQAVPLLLGISALSNPKTALLLAPGAFQAIVERPKLRNQIIKRKAAKTAKQRTTIDKNIENELNRLGLLTVTATGAGVPKQEEQK